MAAVAIYIPGMRYSTNGWNADGLWPRAIAPHHQHVQRDDRLLARTGTNSPGGTGQAAGRLRRRWILAGGTAMAVLPAGRGAVWLGSGRPAGVLPFLIITGVLTIAALTVNTAVSMYEARQQTRRKEIECHSTDILADALARCIDATYTSARTLHGTRQAEEAAKVRASALQFLTQAAPDMLALLARAPEDPADGAPVSRYGISIDDVQRPRG